MVIKLKKDIVTDQILIDAVKNNISLAGVLKYLGKKQAGGTQSHYKRRIVSLGIDTSHFKGQGYNIGNLSNSRKSADDILILRFSGGRAKRNQLRRALMEKGVPYICENCSCEPQWMGNPLIFDIDHINENWLDDRKENLRFLCPNCHSQFTRKLLDF